MSHDQPIDQKQDAPNRRGFIKTSSALVAGSSLASGLSIARAAHVTGDDEIKVGLVGCGGRGTGAAVQALRTEGKVRLVAMGDVFEDFLQRSAATIEKHLERSGHASRFDVPQERRFVGFDAYQKVIDSDIDVVILATPPGFRPIHFQAAVDADKHIFMEKPVAVDAPGVRKVLAAAEQAKQKSLAVGVGLQRRHDPMYLEAVDRIHNGLIGDVMLTRVYWNMGDIWVRPRKPSQTEMMYQVRNWYYFTWICGDHIVEQHIHNLDISNWVKNMVPVKAQGMGGRQVRTGKDHGEIFDHHMVEFTYPDDSVMISQCRQIKDCWSAVSEHAHGTKGMAHLTASDCVIDASGEQLKLKRSVDPYQQEHDDLFLSIRRGEPFNEAEYGALSTMTAILGRMATYSGKELTWDEAINSDVDLSPVEYSFTADPPVTPDEDGWYTIPSPGSTVV